MPLVDRARSVAPLAVGGLLAGSSLIHLLHPAVFRSMVPDLLPAPDVWIRGSGVAEAVCGVGLLTSQPWAGRAAAALLLAVWPGNAQAALDAGTGRNPGPMDSRVVTWGRMPLQLPLVWAALQSRPRPRR